MGHGPWALGHGPWAMGHGPWAMGQPGGGHNLAAPAWLVGWAARLVSKGGRPNLGMLGFRYPVVLASKDHTRLGPETIKTGKGQRPGPG